MRQVEERFFGRFYRSGILNLDFAIRSTQHLGFIATVDEENAHIRVSIDEILKVEVKPIPFRFASRWSFSYVIWLKLSKTMHF